MLEILLGRHVKGEVIQTGPTLVEVLAAVGGVLLATGSSRDKSLARMVERGLEGLVHADTIPRLSSDPSQRVTRE